jgi:hypothetical protein
MSGVLTIIDETLKKSPEYRSPESVANVLAMARDEIRYLSMKDISTFDFEQAIMSCWSIVEDLELLEQSPMTRSLAIVYQSKFEKLFSMFEDLCKEIHGGRVPSQFT